MLRRYHEVKSPLFQLPLHHNNARFQYIYRFQGIEVPTRFCGEEVIRGRRFYGGGSGFLLCFAAERKHCAPESLLQLPLPSHTLLREKDTVQHNGNRAVTAFLASLTLLWEKGLCARIFSLFGTVHCVAFRQKRNAVRPEVRGSSL